MTAVLRTVVPFIWAALVSWLASLGWFTPEQLQTIESWAVPVTGATTVIAGVVLYRLGLWLRKQTWWPDLLNMLVFGSRKAVVPVYPALNDDEMVQIPRQVE